MKEALTSRERLSAAIRSEDVDHVPLVIGFWPTPLHHMLSWKNERERLTFYREKGWDTYVSVGLPITPDRAVRTEVRQERDGDGLILRQTWHTPAGSVTERMKITDDWPAAQDGARPVWFHSDFRTSRYVEFPFKTPEDLACIEYLFPVDSADDLDAMARNYEESRALADEFDVALIGSCGAGMDWLIWLYPAEEAILRALQQPEMARALVSHINAAHHRRLERLQELGVDAVIRRGWYESADFWSPSIFREWAKPAVEAEIRAAHAAGAAYVYIMDTGIEPLLDDLAAMPFDCLLGADPATSGQDLGNIRRSLPGKSLWGGVSGPLHLGRGTAADTERAVEQAFAVCGKTGFVLGPVVGFRHNWPWENMEACERAWRRLR